MSIITVVEIIIGLGLLIFVHELGHYFVSVMRGVKVEKFSLGFGPRLIGFKRNETEYFISLIPLGGYVKLAGDDPEKKLSGEKWEFLSQPWWSRALIYFSGPLMNYALASLIVFSLLAYGVRIPVYTEKPIIGTVNPLFPADKAGIKTGDIISEVNGSKIESWKQMADIISKNADKSLDMTITRENKEIKLSVIPIASQEGRGVIGISPHAVSYTKERLPIHKAFIASINYNIEFTKKFFQWIIKIFTREVSIKESLGGPVMISKLAYQQAKSGLDELFNFLAFLSINLAILNLLPIPVFDGGQIVFCIIEGIRKKPLSIKAQLVFQNIGLAIILFLIAFTTLNDIFFRK